MSNLAIRKHLKLNHSLLWIRHAFIVFREKPIQFFLLQICTSLFTFLPFLGAFLGPLFVAKFMSSANKVEKQHQLKLSDIFQGLFAHKTVVRLAFLNFSLNAIILLIQYFFESGIGGGSLVKPTLSMLFLTIPSLILTLSMWLSPAICFFNEDLHPKTAMWLSIKVCFKNVLVLLAFSIIVAGISLVIALPVFYLLLWVWDSTQSLLIIIPISIIVSIVCLVWFAILNISTYFVYRTVLYKSN